MLDVENLEDGDRRKERDLLTMKQKGAILYAQKDKAGRFGGQGGWGMNDGRSGLCLLRTSGYHGFNSDCLQVSLLQHIELIWAGHRRRQYG